MAGTEEEVALGLERNSYVGFEGLAKYKSNCGPGPSIGEPGRIRVIHERPRRGSITAAVGGGTGQIPQSSRRNSQVATASTGRTHSDRDGELGPRGGGGHPLLSRPGRHLPRRRRLPGAWLAPVRARRFQHRPRGRRALLEGLHGAAPRQDALAIHQQAGCGGHGPGRVQPCPQAFWTRFYVSTRTHSYLRTSHVTLSKGLRSREEEDKVSSYFLLKAIADTCRVSATIQSDIQEPEIPEESMEQFDEDQELQQVIDGQVCMKVYHFADLVEKNFSRKIILPGSFNPLHDGHLRLLEVASSMCDDGLPFFEISASNADKPPLSIAEIQRRVEQFRKAGKNVIISNQPYFYKKAELFPGSAFIIGSDTAARLVNPKYCGGDYNRMLEILLECKSTGTTFLVGDRKIEGVFKVLEDLDIPGELRDMFISIPEEKFLMDISSTEIRKSQKL